ncbi:hypothetical protein B0T18DRAFT_39071 [Schizothecium vesticola]|uniref:Uncharacterized protein n=1 Tax=Schizothecium vesticola TaxID=314040 RepID=A0AA40FB63_9PEZI|nr:hypothetical protein B0T18DRAFT_39071 [Schizothecium vesticola]
MDRHAISPFPAPHLLVVPPTHPAFPPPPPRDPRQGAVSGILQQTTLPLSHWTLALLPVVGTRGLVLPLACGNTADTLPRAPRGGLGPSRWPEAPGAGLDQVTAAECADPASGKEQYRRLPDHRNQPRRLMIVEGMRGRVGWACSDHRRSQRSIWSSAGVDNLTRWASFVVFSDQCRGVQPVQCEA